MKKIILLLCLFFLSSCYKNHLYVQQDKLDKNYLASSHVHTPDPRQKNPPEGQRLSVAWDFPLSIFKEQPLNLILTVRFWDNTQDVFVTKMEKKRGYVIYKFQDPTHNKPKKILTYKVDVVNEDGEIVEQWKHQFWKKLIKINKEENIESIASEVALF